jgi:hypothetical protein
LVKNIQVAVATEVAEAEAEAVVAAEVVTNNKDKDIKV